MLTFARTLLLITAIALGGCAATVTRPTDGSATSLQPSVKPAALALHITGTPAIQASSDWHTFRAEWRTAFNAAAAATSIPTSYTEVEPTELPTGTVLVRVFVNDYRYLTPGARFGFGIMTGNAYIDAEAEFIEFPHKRSLGKKKYSTSSSAWQGVFSAMTDKQVRALSDTMIQDLTQR